MFGSIAPRQRKSRERVLLLSMFALALSACDSSTYSGSGAKNTTRHGNGDLEKSLLADPAKLKETMRRCRDERPHMSEELCAAAHRAFRKQFMGDGASKYTPDTTSKPHS